MSGTTTDPNSGSILGLRYLPRQHAGSALNVCLREPSDVLLVILWLILGGSMLEAITMAILQGILLGMVEGVIRTIHQLIGEIAEKKTERRRRRWEKRRSR